MAIIASPPSYLSATSFLAQANDYDFASYSNTQLQDILNRASGAADSIMRKSYLARERTIQYMGSGDNTLALDVRPILYVKRVQIVVPGTSGPLIPLDQLLVDYDSGQMLEYTPMVWQGQGYFARFPKDIPVAVTLGYGYGYNTAAPSWTTADASGGSLVSGRTYNLAVTSKTMFGESTATVSQITVGATATAQIVTVNPTLGAYFYRAYLSDATRNTTLGGTTYAIGATSFTVASATGYAAGDLILIGAGSTAEVLTVATASGVTITTTAGCVNAHSSGEAVIHAPLLCGESPYTAYGATAVQIAITGTAAPNGVWQDTFPTADTTSPVIPNNLIEATRILALGIVWEQNNLANRGVYTTESGRKRLTWKSTEGNSGRGVSYMRQQAEALLAPLSLCQVF